MGKTYKKGERKNAKKKNQNRINKKSRSYEDVYDYVPLVEIIEEEKNLSIPDRIDGQTTIPKNEKTEYRKKFKISLETVNQIEKLWAYGSNPKTGLSYAWQPTSWMGLKEILDIRDNFINGGVLTEEFTAGYLKHIFLMGYSISKFDVDINGEKSVLEVLKRPDGKLDFNFFCFTINGKKVEVVNWEIPENIWGAKLLLTQKQVGKHWLCGFSTNACYTPNVMLKKLRIAEGRYVKK